MTYKIQRMKINLRLKFSEEYITIKETGKLSLSSYPC